MILYHGSNTLVSKPQIIVSNRYLDFGTGFYTTTNLQQALNFADKVTARKAEGKSIVSTYEFEKRSFDKLKVLGFESADGRWLDFVSSNRNGKPTSAQYDLIYGPVADDDVFRTFILFQSGVLTREQTLEAFKY